MITVIPEKCSNFEGLGHKLIPKKAWLDKWGYVYPKKSRRVSLILNYSEPVRSLSINIFSSTIDQL